MSELAVVLGMLFFLLCLGLVFLHAMRLGRWRFDEDCLNGYTMDLALDMNGLSRAVHG